MSNLPVQLWTERGENWVEALKLSMRGITKRFPGVVALDHVDFDLRPGEVHALVGENGAGKSTLMNVLGGTIPLDEGTIELDGKKVEIPDPVTSMEIGVGFVHQESNLLGNLSVMENVFLAREAVRGVRLDKKRMREEILRVNEKLGYSLDPDAPVESLHLAEQQCVEITRALLSNPRILILDEPTAALDDSEVARLFRIIRTLKEENVSIIYISHRMDEIFQVADRITVLKDGKRVGVRNVNDVCKDDVIAMMVGRVLQDIFPRRDDLSPGEDLLRVEHLSITNRLKDVSCSVRAIFGDIPFTEGKITMNGVEFKSGGIRDRIRRGLGYVTHDRRGEGLILHESLRRNAALASLYRRSCLGFVKKRAELREADETLSRMQIKTSSIEDAVSHLSGGNQQKVMLTRWLMTKPKVLIIDEPTKGVDVGARMSVYQIVDQLTREGIGIIMLTSDMMELIGLSDRVLVFFEGSISRELARSEVTEEKVMRAASGMPIE